MWFVTATEKRCTGGSARNIKKQQKKTFPYNKRHHLAHVFRIRLYGAQAVTIETGMKMNPI